MTFFIRFLNEINNSDYLVKNLNQKYIEPHFLLCSDSANFLIQCIYTCWVEICYIKNRTGPKIGYLLIKNPFFWSNHYETTKVGKIDRKLARL